MNDVNVTEALLKAILELIEKCFQPLSNQLGIHFRHIHQPPITSS